MNINGLKRAVAAACVVGAMMSTPIAAMAAGSPIAAETWQDLKAEGKITNVEKDDFGNVISFDVVDESIANGFQYFILGEDGAEMVYIRDGKYEKGTSDTANFVNRMYETSLERQGETQGLEWWIDQVQESGKTGADIMQGFIGSDEYKDKKKTNEEIIDDFYKATFGREADEGGKAYWLARLDAGMSIDTLVAGFSASNEFKAMCEGFDVEPGTVTPTKWADKSFEVTSFAQRMYNNCLGRGSDEVGLEYWCEKLQNGITGAEIASGFVFSDEAKAQELDDAAFVNMLYKTFMDRAAADTEVAYWVEMIKGGETRENVLNGFVVSTEFAMRCEAAGIRLQ